MAETLTERREKRMAFTRESVLGIKADRKGQTRRVLSTTNSFWGSADSRFWEHADFNAPQPSLLIDNGYLHVPCHCQDSRGYPVSENVDCEFCKEQGWEGTRHRLYPQVQPGDIIVPTCTWAARLKYDHLKPSQLHRNVGIWSWWVSDDKPLTAGRSHSGRFLPKHLWHKFPRLEITEVRVQQLKEISEEDAIAEGTLCWVCGGPVDGTSENDCACFHSTREAILSYAVVWDSINGKKSPWTQNDWVWCYSFKRRES